MRFTVQQTEMWQGMQIVLNAVPAKSTKPILSNAAFESKGDVLSIAATDLDVSIITQIPIQTAEEGAITLPAKKVAEVVRELPDSPLEFSLQRQQMTISSPCGIYKILGLQKDEFPDLPQAVEGTKVDIAGSLLQRMVEKTIFAISTDETRPALNGVLWQMRKDEMRMVATDGHRLAKIVNTQAKVPSMEKEIIIPAKALSCLTRVRSEMIDLKSVTLGENHILFDFGDTQIFSRLIAQTYPNYERVIPKDNEKRLIINRDTLASSLRRVSLLSNAVTHQVRFSLRKDGILLSALDQEIGGEAKEEIDAQFVGEPMEIGYNGQYLLEILSHIESDDVFFELNTPTTAGLVYPTIQKEDEEYLCLIMPLRLND
ncbi:MAG: DNA polymerase III subunit beta [bacterium]